MKLNLNDKSVMRKMGIPFWPYAHWFGIDVRQADLDYNVDVIQKDKGFPLILSCFDLERYKRDLSKLEKAYAQINVIVFFDKFYNDPNCPKGCQLILFTILGQFRDYVKEKYPNLLSERYTYVERWLETIT